MYNCRLIGIIVPQSFDRRRKFNSCCWARFEYFDAFLGANIISNRLGVDSLSRNDYSCTGAHLMPSLHGTPFILFHIFFISLNTYHYHKRIIDTIRI